MRTKMMYLKKTLGEGNKKRSSKELDMVGQMT